MNSRKPVLESKIVLSLNGRIKSLDELTDKELDELIFRAATELLIRDDEYEKTMYSKAETKENTEEKSLWEQFQNFRNGT